MKCEWVRQNIVFYVYDELPDDARHELEQHVARCATCMAELSATKSFRVEMAKSPLPEPSPNFLSDSRMKLQEALESAEQGGWWSRLVFEPVNWLNQIRFAPALAAAIFIVGFAGGIGATYRMAKTTSPGTNGNVEKPVAAASISGITSVAQLPGSNEVTIKYDTVSPQEARGPLNDPSIQQLLLYAARNPQNAGLRNDTMNL